VTHIEPYLSVVLKLIYSVYSNLPLTAAIFAFRKAVSAAKRLDEVVSNRLSASQFSNNFSRTVLPSLSLLPSHISKEEMPIF
jgi:hypothetical protein